MSDRIYQGKPAGAFNFQWIVYEKQAPQATITINRPEVLNAVNVGVLQEMQVALKDASWDDSIAVLVLTGAGDRAFCTGADLKEQRQFLAAPAGLLEVDG